MIRSTVLAVVLVLVSVPAFADLYSATAIVTGTDMRSRPDGMAQALRDVLVKVSGDPALHDDPRVDAIAADAASYVSDFAYEDRMWSIPMHDEQGSRDRPYDLTVHFIPVRIDAALYALGETAWRAPRPPLLADIVLERGAARIPLSADGAPDERAREAALDAAMRYAMRLVLPPAAGPALPDVIEGMATVRLSGTLRPDADYGWKGDWQVRWGGRDLHWSIGHASLDEAFRNAVGGAMRIVSGHGSPAPAAR